MMKGLRDNIGVLRKEDIDQKALEPAQAGVLTSLEAVDSVCLQEAVIQGGSIYGEQGDQGELLQLLALGGPPER